MIDTKNFLDTRPRPCYNKITYQGKFLYRFGENSPI